jgi:hypothetical protein
MLVIVSGSNKRRYTNCVGAVCLLHLCVAVEVSSQNNGLLQLLCN